MKRNFLILPAIALLSSLAGALLYNLLQPEKNTDRAADAAQPIQLQAIPLVDLDEQQSVIGDWRANLLIVNFWAPWCAPCRREIPALIEVHEAYAEKGVRVLGLAFDNAPQVIRFAAEFEIDYPLFLAGNRSAMYNAAFNNPSGSLPFTALLDQDLRIIFRHNGEITPAQLREQLEKALEFSG
ncbi:MAG: TlpA family protein disulfide reductase [Gammaproteobacteria bacterium]|nr:TlpA family protein disulfide reductase [Gammaproteobacteria bacterium]MDH3534742.1 TlpA family protein disulfide reductase [Gammaproteobacteria bacterium]